MWKRKTLFSDSFHCGRCFFHSAIEIIKCQCDSVRKSYFIPKNHYLIGIKYPYETLPEKLLKNERLLLFSHSPLLQALPNTILQQHQSISISKILSATTIFRCNIILHKLTATVETVLQKQYCIGSHCNNNEIPATAMTYRATNNLISVPEQQLVTASALHHLVARIISATTSAIYILHQQSNIILQHKCRLSECSNNAPSFNNGVHFCNMFYRT